MTQQPQDPNIVKFGVLIGKEMTQTKRPDPATWNIPQPRDPILLEALKSISPDLASAEARNHMSCNWPGVEGLTFYFRKIQVEGNWEWQFTEYVKS